MEDDSSVSETSHFLPPPSRPTPNSGPRWYFFEPYGSTSFGNEKKVSYESRIPNPSLFSTHLGSPERRKPMRHRDSPRGQTVRRLEQGEYPSKVIRKVSLLGGCGLLANPLFPRFKRWRVERKKNIRLNRGKNGLGDGFVPHWVGWRVSFSWGLSWFHLHILRILLFPVPFHRVVWRASPVHWMSVFPLWGE